MVELSTSDRCKKKTSADISDSISYHTASTSLSNKFTFQFVTLHLANRTHQPWFVWTGSVLTLHVGAVNGEFGRGSRWGVPAGWRHACMSRGGTVGWVPQKDMLCQTRDEDVPPHESRHVFFFSNRWQRSGDWREKTRVREGGQSAVFPFSPLVFMTFTFYLPLTAAWGPNLVFMSLKMVVWYRMCQFFRAMLAQSSTVVKCTGIKKIK